jgi:hypothetical protein
MTKIVCEECGKKAERTSNNQKYCRKCIKKVLKAQARAYNTSPDGIKHRAAYNASPQGKRRTNKYLSNHRELSSVRRHHCSIFNPKHPSYNHYKGMPFYDGWNPDKGGSFNLAEKWIIENLGKRPLGSTMHIVNHESGFTPGNLEWTHPRKQNNQQMFKIIAQQRHRIKELEKQLSEIRGAQ